MFVLYTKRQYVKSAKKEYKSLKRKLNCVAYQLFAYIFFLSFAYDHTVKYPSTKGGFYGVLFASGISISGQLIGIFYKLLESNAKVASANLAKERAMFIFQKTEGDYSPAIVSGEYVQYISEVKQSNTSLAYEFEQVTKFVTDKNDKITTDIWNTFLEEYKTRKNKTVLRSLWDSLKTKIPALIDIGISWSEIAKITG